MIKDPYFWQVTDRKSRASAPITRALLTPISMIYGAAVQRRIDKTEPHDCGIPVICVGNLTVGGSGKTPIVAALRSKCEAKGLRAASLSRGYGGTLKGPLQVNPKRHSANEVGDEPIMLANHGESWIGADRPAAADAMVKDGVQVIIMDDGHQNPTLKKDLSLIVVDGGNPIGNGFVFPKGPLREPTATGLRRAQAVIWMGQEEIPAVFAETGLPIARGSLSPEASPPSGPLILFAGIGRPQKFFDTISELGGDISESIPFPDHHRFSKGDLDYLNTLAEERAAQLLTTEKDYARLPDEIKQRVRPFPVNARFEPEAMLDEWLHDALNPAL